MPKTRRQELLDDARYLGAVGTPSAETNDLSAAVTWANVPNANITEGSVTQHSAAMITAFAGAAVHIGTSAPATLAGIWIDTTGGAAAYDFNVYNGTAWVTMWTF